MTLEQLRCCPILFSLCDFEIAEMPCLYLHLYPGFQALGWEDAKGGTRGCRYRADVALGCQPHRRHVAAPQLGTLHADQGYTDPEAAVIETGAAQDRWWELCEWCPAGILSASCTKHIHAREGLGSFSSFRRKNKEKNTFFFFLFCACFFPTFFFLVSCIYWVLYFLFSLYFEDP